MKSSTTPVYILSGFLGSGKTTLLTRLIARWKSEGLRPAIVMNELGDVNIDSMIAGDNVPTAEMLGGCICCSIRADLAAGLAQLMREEHPDVIVIEATGAANPMEILDGTAEAALLLDIEVRELITVVDTAHLLRLHQEQKGKTYRLMQEQIRCATALVLNKTDRIAREERSLAEEIVSRWNPYAPVLPAVRCEVDPLQLLGERDGENTRDSARSFQPEGSQETGDSKVHPSHIHVMTYTHRFKSKLDSQEFEAFVARLPREVYRAKGILSFLDTPSRFLFQYAFRETDFTAIPPHVQAPDVIVLIGEHFDRATLAEDLARLEGSGGKH